MRTGNRNLKNHRKKATMKRIILPLTTVLIAATLFLSNEKASSQMVNSLYFLEKTPFHTKWNPAMAPSRSGAGAGISSLGLSVYSDLAFSDIFYPSSDGSKLMTVLHPDLDQALKDNFMSDLGDVSNFGMSMNMDLLNLGLKLGKMYFSAGATMVTDMGIGLPKDFFRLVMNGPGSSGTIDMTDLNVNAMNYVKAGAGLSMEISKKLSIGANVNYLMGIADMRLGFDNFTINATGSSWDIATQGDLRLIAPEFIKLQYDDQGYLNMKNMDQTMDMSYFDNFIADVQTDPMGTLPTSGSGLSFDVGVTFKPLKFLTLSAAVTDFGSIKWDPACINQAKSTGSFTFSGADLAGGDASIDAGVFADMMHLKKVDNPEAYASKLTTKINVGAEAGLANNKLSLGVLSQTGLTETGSYQDFMISANLKPMSLIQTALTYSLLHGEMSSFGAAVNVKLLFLNVYVAADYIPFKVSPQYIPINNSYFNLQTGINMMF